jgi:WD40 repeat protein
MDKSQKKSGSPILVFFAAFAVIAIVTLVINRRSHVVTKLSLPFNNGIANLSTFENLLVAASKDNRLYIWDWTDLSKKPREYTIESEQSALITSSTVISVKRSNPDYVVVSELDDNHKSSKIPLPPDSDIGCLGVNTDRSRIFLLLTYTKNQNAGQVKCELLDVLPGSQQVQQVLTFNAEQGRPGAISVSDDGLYVVGVGDKNGSGWMFVADAKAGRFLWQKEMPEFKKVFKAVFSSNGDFIYARATDSTLLLIKTNSGDITDRLLPTKENKSTFRVQAAQTVVKSDDGNLAAATVFNRIYVWDINAKKVLFRTGSGHKAVSSIVFSGDSRFLATSDMRQGGKIVILKVPQVNK